MRFVIDVINTTKRQSAAREQQQRAINAEVHQLVVLLREAMSGGVAEAFGDVLQELAENGDEIQEGVVAWIELLEVLVQGAEQRYPDGNGKLKKGQVRAAVHAIYNDPNMSIPGIPPSLTPLVMDFVVDWFIDALVDSVQTYGLWDSSKPAHWSLAGFLRATVAFFLDLMQPFFDLLDWLYSKIRYAEPLTPEVAAAVQRVKDKGLVRDKTKLFAPLTEALVFIGRHGPQMTAGVKAFFEVVAMTERLRSATGPEKKAYATSVVKAALLELGFPVEGGLMGAIADVVISAGIESALRLFQKRAPNSFRSRSAFRGGALRGSYAVV